MSDRITVDLCAGGTVQLRNADEVDRWETLRKNYIDDYGLSKTNDLAILDWILQQQILAYRAQQAVNGMVPEVDDDGLLTGKVKFQALKPAEVSKHQESLLQASKEIRALEANLGVDKKSREAGGEYSIRDYIEKLRELGHEYGVHIAERVHAFEFFVNELSWRVRLNESGDDEDRAYHNCTVDGIMTWIRSNLADLEQIDKDFAAQKGKFYVGKV